MQKDEPPKPPTPPRPTYPFNCITLNTHFPSAKETGHTANPPNDIPAKVGPDDSLQINIWISTKGITVPPWKHQAGQAGVPSERHHPG